MIVQHVQHQPEVLQAVKGTEKILLNLNRFYKHVPSALFIAALAVSCQALTSTLHVRATFAIVRWAYTGRQLHIWTRTCGLDRAPPAGGHPSPSR